MNIKNFVPLNMRIFYTNYKMQKKYDVKFAKGATAGNNTVFEGKNVLNTNAKVYSSYVGLGTYIAGNTTLNKAKIGRFCSIGQNVKNHIGRHPSSNFVSTHPSFYSKKNQAGFSFCVNEGEFDEHKFIDDKRKYSIIIGNDVWIGNYVSIMDGVTIGNGAIIGYGALVTKDVEPFTIVGGIPAKKIRKRFTDEQINYLQRYKWWNKSFNWILNNSIYFSSISDFMENFKL
jgi:acetyltransferase-like isoleucine patch superfamily enzyme